MGLTMLQYQYRFGHITTLSLVPKLNFVTTSRPQRALFKAILVLENPIGAFSKHLYLLRSARKLLIPFIISLGVIVAWLTKLFLGEPQTLS